MSYGRTYNRRFCSFKGCSSDILKTRDGAISFFCFPVKDTERCSAWITNSGREEFRYLTPKELAEKRICELHFHSSLFSNFFKTNLKKHAVPNSWDKSCPELIQIDIDDDDSNECEVDVANESLANPVTSENEQLTNDPFNNESNDVLSVDGSILSSVLLGGNHSALEVSCQTSPPTQSSTANEQSPSITSTHKNTQKHSGVEVSQKPTNKSTKNTKFHNLPPETTHTDFYFQHCADFAEETNTNSMPEPPDGEMPLFVQQNSVMSGGADEHANSDIIMMEPPLKRRRRDRGDDDDMPDQMRAVVKHLKSLTSVLAKEDEFELFGRSVALQLKKMTLCTALSVQAKIQNLLSQHRIEDIKREARSKSNKSMEECSEQKESDEMQNDEKKDNVNSTEEGNLETTGSPQLSLTCASEHSDNEVGQ